MSFKKTIKKAIGGLVKLLNAALYKFHIHNCEIEKGKTYLIIEKYFCSFFALGISFYFIIIKCFDVNITVWNKGAALWLICAFTICGKSLLNTTACQIVKVEMTNTGYA